MWVNSTVRLFVRYKTVFHLPCIWLYVIHMWTQQQLWVLLAAIFRQMDVKPLKHCGYYMSLLIEH